MAITTDSFGFMVNSTAIVKGKLGQPSTLAKVMKSGDPIGAHSPGVTFMSWNGTAINASCNVAGKVRVQGDGVVTTSGSANNFAIFVERDGGLDMVARMGNKAVDFDGNEFLDNVFYDTLGEPSLNNLGHVAFFSNLRGGDVTTASDRAIFAEADGTLQMIVREGQQFLVDGLLKTVSLLETDLISAGAPGGGRGTWFNDNDQVIFWARFTDNSEGIFVAAVAEPASALLVSAAGLLALHSTRRTRRH